MNSVENFIGRCIFLASKALGNTYPNPLVGSVIVKSDKIIGEGFHKKAGLPHAEVNAINSVENYADLQQSTIFVSLEPCAHFGKTPPCAARIVEEKIPKVVIGSTDSHNKVSGKGIAILEKKSIEVSTSILENDCRILNKRFFTFHEKKRPFVILKWASSADGFLDKNFEPFPISNSLVNQMMHQIRADEKAIFVGTTTVLRDNPSLSVRNLKGKNPVRIVLDFDLKIPKNSKIYNDEAETIILNSTLEKTENNITFKKINKENLVGEILNSLYQSDIQSVIIEGGAKILQQFIDSGIWDEAIVIKNPELFLQKGTPKPIFNFKPKNEITVRNNIVRFYKNS